FCALATAARKMRVAKHRRNPNMAATLSEKMVPMRSQILLAACLAISSAQRLPPESISFPNTYGAVTFTHKKHFERVGGDCSACHTAIFPQSRADINYKKALHRAAEASKRSCAACHRVGGTASAADSNCTNCHAPKFKYWCRAEPRSWCGTS